MWSRRAWRNKAGEGLVTILSGTPQSGTAGSKRSSSDFYVRPSPGPTDITFLVQGLQGLGEEHLLQPNLGKMLLQGNLRVLRGSATFKQGPAARLPNPARASLGESSQTRLAPALMKDKTGCSANLVVWAEALQEVVTQPISEQTHLHSLKWKTKVPRRVLAVDRCLLKRKAIIFLQNFIPDREHEPCKKALAWSPHTLMATAQRSVLPFPSPALLLNRRPYNQRLPFPEQAHVLPLSNELDNPNSNSSLPCTQTYLPGLEWTWAGTGENNGALAGGTMLSGCHQNRASTCFPFCGAYELVPVYSTRRCKRNSQVQDPKGTVQCGLDRACYGRAVANNGDLPMLPWLSIDVSAVVMTTLTSLRYVSAVVKSILIGIQ
ncbi:hypothetical protein U0070_026472 [Myodes glareolus]|uniref:Uncharacterized protein n=1 Tax=Myodes glareolus TaxID=447135 RepID=A0AAW0JKK6_MYOGA